MKAILSYIVGLGMMFLLSLFIFGMGLVIAHLWENNNNDGSSYDHDRDDVG